MAAGHRGQLQKKSLRTAKASPRTEADGPEEPDRGGARRKAAARDQRRREDLASLLEGLVALAD